MKNPFENIEPACITGAAGAASVAGGTAAMGMAAHEIATAAAAPLSDQFEATMQLGESLRNGGMIAFAIGGVVSAASLARLFWINRQ